MKDSPEKISPLRRRMIEDMRMRKLSAQTQSGYLRAVRHFSGFLGRSPDTATDEDLRRYQLHCVDRGISPTTLNATITGLKFFFEVTLKRPELMNKMSHVRVARTLPVVLSREEASRLIESARTLKARTALSVAYGAGLRVSEVCALKVGDIDSQRMLLRIEEGNGQKDRYALLPPILLERLRTWWRYARAQGTMLPGGYLFPGMDPILGTNSTKGNSTTAFARRRPAHLQLSTSFDPCPRRRLIHRASGDKAHGQPRALDAGVRLVFDEFIKNLLAVGVLLRPWWNCRTRRNRVTVCQASIRWSRSAPPTYRERLWPHRRRL